MMSDIRPILSRITIFPIKSLDPVAVAASKLLSSGALEHDRTWALFDTTGAVVNGKRTAAVHLLRSRVNFDAGTVSLSRNGKGRTFATGPSAGALEEWLSGHFGFPVSFRRNDEMGFPDDTASPGPTLISVATLLEVGRWFSLPVEQVRDRLRTNLEIDGVPAFWEDGLFGPTGTVIRFRIGETTLKGINPCQRCVVPLRDPLTGSSDDTFVRRFTELRSRTIPAWASKERFDHFYRVAINTKPHGDQGGRMLRVGDAVELIDQPAIAPGSSNTRSTQHSDFWAGNLVVDTVWEEAPGVKTIRLRHPDQQTLPFRFRPGQFLSVTIEGLQRCYTIASSPSDETFCEITVKRDGRASGLLHDRIAAGTRLPASGPMGSFSFDGERMDNVVLIAGGVGITPLMCKIRFLAAKKWPGRIDLIYSAKSEPDIIFRNELDALQRSFTRLKVHVTLTYPDELWEGARGRLTPEWIRAVVPDIAGRSVRLCGPTSMAASVRQMLLRLNVLDGQIEAETFGGRAKPAEAEGNLVQRSVTFVRSDRVCTIEGRKTILDAAIAAGVPLDHGCRAGVCGRCRTTLLDGKVVAGADFVLTAADRSRGIVLACQASPCQDVRVDC
ncbi:MAG: 2Fe-2S iron-sulfur cluster-binding protein [Janthinobacterium lividum]